MKNRSKFLVLLGLIPTLLLAGCDAGDLARIGEIFRMIGEGAQQIAGLFGEATENNQQNIASARDVADAASTPAPGPKPDETGESKTGRTAEGTPGLDDGTGAGSPAPGTADGGQGSGKAPTVSKSVQESVKRGLKQIEYNLSDLDRSLKEKLTPNQRKGLSKVLLEMKSIRDDLKKLQSEEVTTEKAEKLKRRFEDLDRRFKAQTDAARAIAGAVEATTAVGKALMDKIATWQNLLIGGGKPGQSVDTQKTKIDPVATGKPKTGKPGESAEGEKAPGTPSKPAPPGNKPGGTKPAPAPSPSPGGGPPATKDWALLGTKVWSGWLNSRGALEAASNRIKALNGGFGFIGGIDGMGKGYAKIRAEAAKDPVSAGEIVVGIGMVVKGATDALKPLTDAVLWALSRLAKNPGDTAARNMLANCAKALEKVGASLDGLNAFKDKLSKVGNAAGIFLGIVQMVRGVSAAIRAANADGDILACLYELNNAVIDIGGGGCKIAATKNPAWKFPAALFDVADYIRKADGFSQTGIAAQLMKDVQRQYIREANKAAVQNFADQAFKMWWNSFQKRGYSPPMLRDALIDGFKLTLNEWKGGNRGYELPPYSTVLTDYNKHRKAGTLDAFKATSRGKMFYGLFPNGIALPPWM